MGLQFLRVIRVNHRWAIGWSFNWAKMPEHYRPTHEPVVTVHLGPWQVQFLDHRHRWLTPTTPENGNG